MDLSTTLKKHKHTEGMEAGSSTIGKNWRLCIFASFMSFIVLMFFQKQCQNSPKLSSLLNVGVSMSMSSLTSTSSELLESTNLVKNESTNLVENDLNPMKEEEVKCNIFDGKWVYEPEGGPQHTAAECPFLSEQVSCQRNGRPDFEYEKWRWEAKDCDVPRFNGIDMLERLRGKRVIIVGDSLNRNQWESLACLLYSAIPSSQAHVDVRSGVYKVFKAKDYNCSVEFYWSPFLVQLKQENGNRILRLDKLSPLAKKWRGADVMVFNTAHWWVHSGKVKSWDLFQYKGKLVEEMEIESALRKGMRTWARWIDHYVDATKTTVFFRSISPQHQGKQWCYNITQPNMDESYVSAFPKPMKEIIEITIRSMMIPVRYLNITKLSEYRRDAHPALYARKQEKFLKTEQQLQEESHPDCSHWCLPGLPDTWNRLLYASLVVDTSNSKHLVA
ncbi:hypothetical protein Peur_025573 [Populus x canadensis]